MIVDVVVESVEGENEKSKKSTDPSMNQPKTDHL